MQCRRTTVKKIEEQLLEKTDQNQKEQMIISNELNIDSLFKDFVNVDGSLLTRRTH